MAKYDWGSFGFHIPEIMLPKEGTDYSKWAVVACDQYTSEPEYWDAVKDTVGSAPSTLSMFLPEVYLDEGNMEAFEAMKAGEIEPGAESARGKDDMRSGRNGPISSYTSTENRMMFRMIIPSGPSSSAMTDIPSATPA